MKLAITVLAIILFFVGNAAGQLAKEGRGGAKGRSAKDGSGLIPAKVFRGPTSLGVHMAELDSGEIKFLGDWQCWSISPSGQCVAGTRKRSDTETIEYRNLSNFRLFNPIVFRLPDEDARGCAQLEWSSDSSGLIVKFDKFQRGNFTRHTFQTDCRGTASNYLSSRSTIDEKLPKNTMLTLKKRFSEIYNVRYSPDKKWVAAYLSKGEYFKQNFGGGIYIFKPDGSGLTRVTQNVWLRRKDAVDRDHVWLPDSKRLVFRRTAYEDEGIY